MAKKKFTPVAIPPCPWHKNHEMGYLQFFEDAAKRDEKGQRQKRCHVCGYWYWPDHFGVDPFTQLLTPNT